MTIGYFKEDRRIGTRFENLATSFLGMLKLVFNRPNLVILEPSDTARLQVDRCTILLREYAATPYRGFESLRLRHLPSILLSWCAAVFFRRDSSARVWRATPCAIPGGLIRHVDRRVRRYQLIECDDKSTLPRPSTYRFMSIAASAQKNIVTWVLALEGKD